MTFQGFHKRFDLFNLPTDCYCVDVYSDTRKRFEDFDGINDYGKHIRAHQIEQEVI